MQTINREINQDVYWKVMKLGYSEICAKIVAARTDHDPTLIFDKNFNKEIFSETILLMKDLKKSAIRIKTAIEKQENIMLFTDFDADGCCSMAILSESFMLLGALPQRIFQLTGNRLTDGYGLNQSLVNTIEHYETNLLITADVGISNYDEITHLTKNETDVILTDHHLVPDNPPQAFAIVNPHQKDCQFPFKNLCGAAIAWVLMVETAKTMKCNDEIKKAIYEMLDIAALATVGDMVALNDPFNRKIVSVGLNFINQRKRPCWRACLSQDKPADVQELAFQIAPAINAVSRLTGECDTAIRFLTTQEDVYAKQYWSELQEHNGKRKTVQNNMIKSIDVPKEPCFVHYDHQFHSAVVGIAAGQLSRKYNIPVILFADRTDDIMSGSGRSPDYLHLKDCLDIVQEQTNCIIRYGGHANAAGLSIYKKDFEIFKKTFFQACIDKTLMIDTSQKNYIDGSLLEPFNFTMAIYEEIYNIAPFGIKFPEPAFCDVFTVTEAQVIGKIPVHLKLSLNSFKAIWFFALKNENQDLPCSIGDRVKVVYSLSKNVWQGYTSLQIIVDKLEVVNL